MIYGSVAMQTIKQLLNLLLEVMWKCTTLSFVELNSGSCIWWTSSDRRMRNILLLSAISKRSWKYPIFRSIIKAKHSSRELTYNWRCTSSLVLLHRWSILRLLSRASAISASYHGWGMLFRVHTQRHGACLSRHIVKLLLYVATSSSTCWSLPHVVIFTQTDSISLLSATLSVFQNCSQNCERNSPQHDINTHEDLQLTHYFITLYVISLVLIISVIRAAMLCRRTCERYWQDPNTEKRDRV